MHWCMCVLHALQPALHAGLPTWVPTPTMPACVEEGVDGHQCSVDYEHRVHGQPSHVLEVSWAGSGCVQGGQTALGVAAINEDRATALLLLGAGAKPSAIPTVS